jgi:NADPH:quinone reductase
MAVNEYPAVPPAPNEVCVRVSQCGVCASNVAPWQGRSWFNYPLEPGAPGHEASGEIAAIGEAMEGWHVGERVSYIGYRGFAELENVPAGSLLRLPGDCDDDFIGEPLACAMNIFRRAGVRPGDVVAIVGLGFLGRLLVPVILQRGAQVIAVTRRECGIDDRVTLVVGTDTPRMVEEVRRLTHGNMCDVVIEATGAQTPLELAGELTKVRGRLVIAGYHQEGRQVNMQLWNWRGLDVINAHERDPEVYLEGMRLAIDAVRAGPWRQHGLITHRFPFDQLGEALRCTAERPPGFIKAAVTL